jgi:hypothetical protein
VQALHLMNSGRLTGKLGDPSGRAAALASSQLSPREIVDELYLAAYSRFPTPEKRNWRPPRSRAKGPRARRQPRTCFGPW